MNCNLSLLSNASAFGTEIGVPLLLPLYMDTFLYVTHLMCTFIGFPLTLLVISFIVHSKRLHKPRYIVWLGVAFSNILILFHRLLELFAFVLHDQWICRILIFMIDLPYTTLLLNLFLALVDRYVSITYASWYKKHVQICYIIVGQITAVTLLIIVTKYSYIVQLVRVDYLWNSTDGIKVSVIIHILIALCIAGQITVYYKTKNVLLAASQNLNRHLNRETTEQGNFAVNVGDDRQNPNAQHNRQIFFNEKDNSFFVRVCNQTISRLEVEAAHNLTAAILSLFIFSVPSFLVFAVGMGCVHYFNDIERCSAIGWASAYASELNLFITIYNPIFFIQRNRDFSEALRQSIPSFRMTVSP